MDLNSSSTWRRPALGVVKVNVRGIYLPSATVNRCLAGLGIVIRDHNGCWISSIAGIIRRIQCKKMAELFAIYAGLMLAWDNGVRHIWLETQSESAFNELYDHDPESRYTLLVNDIISLMSLRWECRIYLVSRTSNDVASLMALDGVTKREVLFQLDEPIPELIPLPSTESLNPQVQIDKLDDIHVPLLVDLDEDGERLEEYDQARTDGEESTNQASTSEEIQLQIEEDMEVMEENEPKLKKQKTEATSASTSSI